MKTWLKAMPLARLAGDACCSAALLMAGGMLPPLHVGPGPLLSALLLAVGLALLGAGRPLGWRHLLLLPIPLLAVALPLPARAAAIWFALALLRWIDPAAPRVSFLSRLALLGALYSLALTIPQVAFLFEFLAGLQAAAIELTSGTAVRLGESALLHIPLFFLLRGLLQWVAGGGVRRIWTSTAGTVAQLAALGLLWRLDLITTGALGGWLPPALFLLHAGVDALAGDPDGGMRAEAARQGTMRSALQLVPPLVIALLLAICLAPPAARLEGLAVGVRQAGQWSPALPTGAEGPAPELGGFLAVLRTWGARVEILDDDALAAGPPCRVLFVVQPDQALRADVLAGLDRWMRQGGVVVAVGEHTHVHGIGAGMTSLLAGRHIRLRNDSALPTLNGWLWSHNQRIYNSAAMAGLRDSQHVGVSVGASLDLSFPAMPLLTGCLAFSDAGNPTNLRGQMGNMRADPGERLGAVPLMAAEAVGKGLLVVLGDKSPLMSLNNPLVWPFYLNLSGRLAARTAWTENRWLLLSLLGLLALALAPALRGLPADRELLLALLVTPLLAWPQHSGILPPPADLARSRIVWIDHSHQPSWWHPPAHDWSQSALVQACFRTGLVPLALHDLDEETIAGSRAVLVAGSAERYSRRDCARLIRYAEAGGRLVVAGDHRRQAGLRPLLDELGLALGETPLGSAAEARGAAGALGFTSWEAWELHDLRGGADTLASCWGMPFVLRRSMGKGSATLVGDERAFSRWSLEGPARGGSWQSTATRFRQSQPPPPARKPGPAKSRHMAGAEDHALPPAVPDARKAGPPPTMDMAAPMPEHELRARWMLALLGIPERGAGMPTGIRHAGENRQ